VLYSREIGKEQQVGELNKTSLTEQLIERSEPEPQLSEFYHPSEEQRKYEYLFIPLGMGLSSYISSKV